MATAMAKAFQTSMFGQAVTYNGTSITAVFSAQADPERNLRADSQAAAGVLHVRKADVSAPKYRDLIVIDGLEWRMVGILSSDEAQWRLSIERDRRMGL